MRYHVVNLGCKVNRVESDAFERQLASAGNKRSRLQDADLVIVNTCTVTAVAEKKTRKAVRQALRANPDATVIVTGCASTQRPGFYEELSDKVKVVPKWEVSDHLAAFAAPNTGAVGAFDTAARGECDTAARGGFDTAARGECGAAARGSDHWCEAGGVGGVGKTRGVTSNDSIVDNNPTPTTHPQPQAKARMGVKVQDGCANECAYCIVHMVRGPEVSAVPEKVLEDARALAAQGVSEIVLTGINLGRYDHGGMRLSGLLQMLLEDGPACRYRLSSIEPDNLDDDLIALVAASGGRICRQFHLPLQSGCTKVLREMGRKYTPEDFQALLVRIRSAIPNASVTTDVIAGFPGETDDEFEATCDFVRACAFSKMHVFPYSEREGTPAAERADQIPHDVRIQRASKLRRIADEMRAADLASRKGTVEEAVVEDGTDCLTESYHWLAAPPGSKNGDVVKVRL